MCYVWIRNFIALFMIVYCKSCEAIHLTHFRARSQRRQIIAERHKYEQKSCANERERSDLRILVALRELQSNAAMRSFYSWWCNPVHVGFYDV